MIDNKFSQVERACIHLAHDGALVTFTAIADATGLARSTLYRNKDLRAVIDRHRHTTSGPITAISDEIATLRTIINELSTKVRSHEEQLRRITRNR